MQIVDNLSKILLTNRVSVLKFSKETGIPSSRVYKWRNKHGSPKHEDVIKIEEWVKAFNKQMDYTPITTSERVRINPASDKDRRIAELEELLTKAEDDKKFLKELIKTITQKG